MFKSYRVLVQNTCLSTIQAFARISDDSFRAQLRPTLEARDLKHTMLNSAYTQVTASSQRNIQGTNWINSSPTHPLCCWAGQGGAEYHELCKAIFPIIITMDSNLDRILLQISPESFGAGFVYSPLAYCSDPSCLGQRFPLALCEYITQL